LSDVKDVALDVFRFNSLLSKTAFVDAVLDREIMLGRRSQGINLA